LLAINGIDERFMEGMTGEDDDFALRMSHSGVPLYRNHEIIGIHQDHSREDKNDIHSFRFNKKTWNGLRNFNWKLLVAWRKHKDPVANKNINWGSDDAIIKMEIF
jgi:GT2 family glycosyltransferase